MSEKLTKTCTKSERDFFCEKYSSKAVSILQQFPGLQTFSLNALLAYF